MYKRFLLLLFVVGFTEIRCEECDKLGILLYEDLSCKPKTVPGNPCPTHYECDEFVESNQTCLFQSEQIAIDESVNDTLIYPACRIGCRCTLNDVKNKTAFYCAVLDCPEWLGDGLDISKCYRTYTLGECCATGHKCPPFDNSTTCVVDGKEYKEGETFDPSNTCLSCVCQKGFKGQLEAPFCKRQICAEQIDNFEKLAENCAPVYLREPFCCPSSWVCPSSTDQIKLINPKLAPNSNLTCKWGKQALKLGEGLETTAEHFDETRSITCECVIPPFLTCKEIKK